MTTAARVPVTRDEELEGDEALETLRQAGRVQLLRDAVDRFRAADGFSHSRALAFQATLTLLPALIAIVGLAAAVEIESFSGVIRETIRQLAPGAVGDIFSDALKQGTSAAHEESGEIALTGGGIAAVLAGTTAMAQVERGANRIYGTETDRPFLRKYLNAVVLAATAGTLAILSAAVLVGGAAIRDTVGFGETLDTVWVVLRWPLGIALAVASIALLFQHAPRRHQPDFTWLAFGAATSCLLWFTFMGVFVLYSDVIGGFGKTYGPIAGTIGLLVWTFLSAVALFLGLAVAAQLEAVRAGAPAPRRPDEHA